MRPQAPAHPAARRLAALAAALASLALAPAAHAGIWQRIDSGTDQTITSIDYQSADRFWLTTSGAILKRAGGSFTSQLSAPGAGFTKVQFNPSGTVGLATGAAGGLWRFAGGRWARHAPLTTYAWNGSTAPCGTPTAQQPVTEDLTNVRWVSDTSVFVFSRRRASILRSDDAGATWREVDRQADGSCRINDTLQDAFVLPSDPSFQYYLGSAFAGQLFLTTTGLQSSALLRGDACGDRLGVDPADPQDVYVTGGCTGIAYSHDGGVSFASAVIRNGRAQPVADSDVAAHTALAAGDAGYILTSDQPAESFVQPADGAASTADWRAVDLASPTQGAVGGVGGMLVVSDHVDAVPDLAAPTGSIGGPDGVSVGAAATFTASAADEPRGSGIDPAGYAWTRDGAAAGTGPSVTLTFDRVGTSVLRLSFADRAGHVATAEKLVDVEPPPPDEQAPTGRITGPGEVVAGTPATYTVDAADTGGSGLDPDAYAWTDDEDVDATGSTVTVTFSHSGLHGLRASFADRAGNAGGAVLTVAVAPRPQDRAAPVPVPAAAPKLKPKGPKWWTVHAHGGYTLPPSVPPKYGCRGQVRMDVLKGKHRIARQRTKVTPKCRWARTFRIRRSKVGRARKLKMPVRFMGTKWLRATRSVYVLEVPRH